MPKRLRSFGMLFTFLSSFGIAVAQEAIPNWPAPELWSHPVRTLATEKQSGTGTEAVEAVEAVPTAPLHFVGITPCRVADTRGNGFAGQYGPPALTPVGRNMVIAGQCGIPGDAQAVSFNFSAVNVSAAGFFVAYPAGGAFPAVATMTYNQNTPNLSNAAVVPLGTGGAITVVAAVTTIDLVVDVNGYYRAGVVTAVNGLAGNVTLAAGSNVTITPSGQTLTVAATGGPGGLLPTGTANQTLRHNGSSWIANSTLTNDGVGVTVAGPLVLPQQPLVNAGLSKFIHSEAAGADASTFLGISAGFAAGSPVGNTGVGYSVLGSATAESQGNTGVGSYALAGISSGDFNIGVGRQALNSLTTGDRNIAIGDFAGAAISTGSNNIYIGNAGFNNESGQIRIGDATYQNGAVIVGIAGSVVAGTPVVVTGGGRLGVAASSLRFKDDIQDVADRSDAVMKLRPVAFKYKPDIDPSGTTQYGLIAEEVAKIYPELVVSDEAGRPRTVRYELVNALLLNHVQKQNRKLEAQEKTIDRQQAEIDELRSELAKIQSKISGN